MLASSCDCSCSSSQVRRLSLTSHLSSSAAARSRSCFIHAVSLSISAFSSRAPSSYSATRRVAVSISYLRADHVERTDLARYHFRKPYKCPRCHALCHAPKIHTHLHKEKEGLLDVASDTAMAVNSRGVSFSGKRHSNRKRSGKRQSAIYKNETAGIPSLSQSTEQNGC